MVKLLYDETNPRALNKEEIKEVITFRLRSLIKNVYENSPFYHRIFKDRGLRPEDIRSIEDLTKIPYGGEFLAVNFENVVGWHMTSEQLEFLLLMLILKQNDIETWTNLVSRCLITARYENTYN